MTGSVCQEPGEICREKLLRPFRIFQMLICSLRAEAMLSYTNWERSLAPGRNIRFLL